MRSAGVRTAVRRAFTVTTVLTAAVLVVGTLVIGSAGPAGALDPNGSAPASVLSASTVPSAEPPPGPPASSGPGPAGIGTAALAPAGTDTIYRSIQPCRLVDTRLGSGDLKGPLANGVSRSYRVAGSVGFAAQGGLAAGCGIPASATAVSVSFVPLTPSAEGYLRAWPTGTAEPKASVINYGLGRSSSGVTLTITPGTSAANLTVKNYGGPAGLVVDVFGYYAPQLHGMIGPGGTVFAGTSRIVSATNPSPGVYVVTFDESIEYCTPMVDTYNNGQGVYGAAYAFTDNQATVLTWRLDPTTHLEVLDNYYVYLSVVC